MTKSKNNYTIKIEKRTFSFKDGWFTRLVHSHSNYYWTLNYDYGKERPYVDSGSARTEKKCEKDALASIAELNERCVNRNNIKILEGTI